MAEILAVSEALNGIKDEGFRARFPGIFGRIGELVRQRNTLAHNYGQVFKEVDWDGVWDSIENHIPSLEIKIELAIKDLSIPENT